MSLNLKELLKNNKEKLNDKSFFTSLIISIIIQNLSLLLTSIIIDNINCFNNHMILSIILIIFMSLIMFIISFKIVTFIFLKKNKLVFFVKENEYKKISLNEIYFLMEQNDNLYIKKINKNDNLYIAIRDGEIYNKNNYKYKIIIKQDDINPDELCWLKKANGDKRWKTIY